MPPFLTPSRRRKPKPFGGPDTGRQLIRRPSMQPGIASRTPAAPARPPAAPPGQLQPDRQQLRRQFRDVSGDKLRDRLKEFKGNDEKADRRQAILSTLRDRKLKRQFGKDYKDKAYGDIEGYESGLSKKLKELRGIEAPSEDQSALLEKLKAARQEVKARRQTFRPGRSFNTKTKEFDRSMTVGSREKGQKARRNKKRKRGQSVGSDGELTYN